MNSIGNQYRPGLSPTRTQHRPRPQASQSLDRVTLSTASEPRDLKKMAFLGGLGSALGVAAAAILCPAVGVAGLVLGGLVGELQAQPLATEPWRRRAQKKPLNSTPTTPATCWTPTTSITPATPITP